MTTPQKKSSLVLFLAAFIVAGCSKQSLIKSPETSTRVSGSISYSQNVTLPAEASLHVILSDVSSPQVPEAIAEQTIQQPEGTSIPFEVHYDSSRISPEGRYAIQACVKSGGQVRFASHKPYPVLTQGNPEQVEEVTLDPVETLLPERSPAAIGANQDNSTLQQSINATLSGACQLVASRYDRITQKQVSEILPPELLSGPHHKLQETVLLRGPEYFYLVDSDFGQFQAQGTARLRRLVREINAIAAMNKQTNTESFKAAFSDSALGPLVELKNLALHPADTLSGIPKGLWTFATSSKQSVTRDRSEYEDRYLAALLTVSKYKRHYAGKLNIDAYTSNPEVQKELNRLGWAGAIANWTPNLLLLPVAGPGKALYSAFNWTETINDLVTQKAPDVLRQQNDEKLKAMGISAELRDRFLSHKYYSPRNHTVITEYLASMSNATGQTRVIEQAISADSEVDAFTYQQIVEILAGYNRSISPIEELGLHKGIPVGYAENGSVVMGFPVDLGRWTPFSEYLFVDFGKDVEGRKVSKRELWIMGELTPLARQAFGKLDISVTENVDVIIGMMD